MIFNVYGAANATSGMINYLQKNIGAQVNVKGHAGQVGVQNIRLSVKSGIVERSLKEDAYHIFTRFEGTPKLINDVLKKTKHRGKLIAHISYGLPSFNLVMKELDFSAFDHIFCCNKVYINKLKQIGVNAKYLPNSIDPKKINFLPVNKSDFGNIFAYSLKYSYAKNYPNLLRFFGLLLEYRDDFKLTIKAASTKNKRCMDIEKECIKLLSRLGISDKVTLINTPINTSIQYRSNYSDANTHLKGKDSCISYSRWESFGFTIAEALLAGKQVFVKGWNTPMNPKQFWGDYVYATEHDMIEAILKYRDTSITDRESIAIKNRKFVEDNFSPAIAVNILLKGIRNEKWS